MNGAAASRYSIRRARPSDSAAICDLYAEAYGGREGDSKTKRAAARQHYPFPQFLDEHWVERAAADHDIVWVVADWDGQVVGSAGALKNIGTAYDRVSEIFGIVVHEGMRGTGVGTGLLNALCHELAEHSAFIACEARTAERAAWRIAQRAGFRPIGFEPFAHRTPIGSESMLMTARVRIPSDQRHHAAEFASPRIQTLATHLLEDLRASGGQRWNSPMFCEATGETEGDDLSHSGIRMHPGFSDLLRIPRAEATTVRDDVAGEATLQQWATIAGYPSGVIGLRRLEGDISERYDRRYYVSRFRGVPISAARVSIDTVDQRARILDLKTTFDGVQEMMVKAILADLFRDCPSDQLSIVVDVRVDSRKLQLALENLGFVPTVYYPAFIGDDQHRYDAIQFVYLRNCPPVEQLRNLHCRVDWNDDWPTAGVVADCVIDGFSSATGEPQS